MDALKVHWFPGHMAKTRRLMQQNLKMVDVVVELLDARIPLSSRNPEIDKIVNDKPRVVVLNKSDMAVPEVTAGWLRYFKNKGITAIALDCKSGRGVSSLVPAIKEVLSEILERRKIKGNEGRPIRMMIVGIPNVGKSSLINRLAGNKRTKVEDRPGVTRGKQWVTLANGVELLDMPGVLWPKIDDAIVGEHLAFVGSVRDQILDIEHMAMRMLELINKNYPHLLSRFKITEDEAKELDPYDLLQLVAKKRGMLLSGGVVNMERAAITVMDEYRGGKMGALSLEFPPIVIEKKRDLPTAKKPEIDDKDEE